MGLSASSANWLRSWGQDLNPDSTSASFSLPGAETTGWPLHLLWQADPQHLTYGLPKDLFESVDPGWQLLLLGDGYTTRNLQLLIGDTITPHVIESVATQSDTEAAPPELHHLGSDLIRRRVWLSPTHKPIPLLYAISWWDPIQMDQYFANPDLPIGQSLAQSQLEIFRDICSLYVGYSPFCTRLFQKPGPFWARHYLLRHQQKPLTLIYEVFSPDLAAYLNSPAPMIRASH